MKLSDFVVPEAILTDLQATGKEEAIREIVRSLQQAGCISEAGGAIRIRIEQARSAQM